MLLGEGPSIKDINSEGKGLGFEISIWGIFPDLSLAISGKNGAELGIDFERMSFMDTSKLYTVV